MTEETKNFRIEIMVNTTEDKASKLLDDVVDFVEETAFPEGAAYEIIDANTDETLNI